MTEKEQVDTRRLLEMGIKLYMQQTPSYKKEVLENI